MSNNPKEMEERANVIMQKVFGKNIEEVTVEIAANISSMIMTTKAILGPEVKQKLEHNETDIVIADASYNAAMIKALIALGGKLFYEQFGSSLTEEEQSVEAFLKMAVSLYESINNLKIRGQIMSLPRNALPQLKTVKDFDN